MDVVIYTLLFHFGNVGRNGIYYSYINYIFDNNINYIFDNNINYIFDNYIT
jgi:hypothetical protein